MFKLRGIISDRIRAGLIPRDTVMVDRPALQPEPKTSSIRHAEGHGLGRGATRKRDGTNK